MTFRCPICGLSYNNECREDEKLHTEYHERYQDASKIFGKILLYEECESVKIEMKKIIDILCKKGDRKNIVTCFEIYIYALFSRSIRHSLNSNTYKLHPKFNEYVAMLLVYEGVMDYVPARYAINVHKNLIQKYGKMQGIQPGCTDWKPNSTFDVTPRA